MSLLSKLRRERHTSLSLHSSCYAPHSALYFRPDGQVSACCATGYAAGYVNGEVRRSLWEIWNGAELAAQRAALEADQYDFGCQECEFAEAAGDRSASLASNFDRWSTDSPHPYPKLLDFALSNRCNLQCVMCNGELSSSIRKNRENLPPLVSRYDDRFFAELEEFLPHAERLQFKGGEPFLARENRRVWDFLIEHGSQPEVTVTTNGTIFNENVAHYVRELRMHPNISVDGIDAGKLESIRVGVEAVRLWHNVDRFQELAEEAGNGMTLSFCLMPQNWMEMLPFIQESDRRGLNCNIIFVNQPDRYDLFKLPHSELEEIEHALSALPSTFETDLARREWELALTRIRSQIEHPVSLRVSVSNVTPAEPHPHLVGMTPVERDRFVNDLRASLDVDPLVMSFTDGLVTDVLTPPWAHWLGGERWIGLTEAGIGEDLGSRPNSSYSTVNVVDGDPSVERVKLAIDVDGRTENLLISIIIDTGRRDSWIFVSPSTDEFVSG